MHGWVLNSDSDNDVVVERKRMRESYSMHVDNLIQKRVGTQIWMFSRLAVRLITKSTFCDKLFINVKIPTSSAFAAICTSKYHRPLNRRIEKWEERKLMNNINWETLRNLQILLMDYMYLAQLRTSTDWNETFLNDDPIVSKSAILFGQ